MSIKMSFFAQPSYVSHRSGDLKRGSSMIRGQQISEYLGAKYNPTEGYEDDVCIYVKPTPDMYGVLETGQRAYVDILDSGPDEVNWLKEHPGINVIAASQSAYEYLVSALQRDNIILIPQHHCNYERIKRQKGKPFSAGHINTPRGLQKFLGEVSAACDSAGVELKTLSLYKDRLDIRNFYEEIDLQIQWRSHKLQTDQMKNALKLANAGSFGIPSVARPEVGYKEYEGYYVPANSLEELAERIKEFKESTELYELYSSKNLEKAEGYHIEHIAKQYLGLLEA